jgi:hypothetical protein
MFSVTKHETARTCLPSYTSVFVLRGQPRDRILRHSFQVTIFGAFAARRCDLWKGKMLQRNVVEKTKYTFDAQYIFPQVCLFSHD